MRLNKFLALAGIASRRKADELIRQGEIRVNGKIVTEMGIDVDSVKDNIQFKNKIVYLPQKCDYILLNKPKDCITTTRDEKNRKTVLDFVKFRNRVYPVGRLDRNTTGVLLLTNDGELAYRLTHPKYKIKKTYEAVLDNPIRVEDVNLLRKGVLLEDGMTQPARIQIADDYTVNITIHEGKNHLIKRMFAFLGYDVVKLDRKKIAGLTSVKLRRGRWRHLTHTEVIKLKQKIGLAGNKANKNTLNEFKKNNMLET